uniref:Reverse transcriptase n=1 Tax=Chenopodium quinoa TaxID=63459 RepID=A0A803LMK0_CHEQI
MEVFSRRLDHLQVSGSLKGIKVSRSRPTISHLISFFADDVLFFLKADIENFGVMKSTIDQFCNLSGEMGVKDNEKMGTYLGCPIDVDGRSTGVFQEIVGKIASKLSSWKPIYWRKTSLLENHKHDGGIGLWNLKSLNQALVFKQAWRMHSNQQLNVSKIFRAKYKDDWFDKGRRGEMNTSMSWGARSIFKSIYHLREGLKRTIAYGKSIKVEHDWWVTDKVIKCKNNQLPSTEQKPIFISDLIDEHGKWKAGLVCKWFSPVIAKHILAIHPGNQLQSDGWD